jgi:hypothetical protein
VLRAAAEAWASAAAVRWVAVRFLFAALIDGFSEAGAGRPFTLSLRRDQCEKLWNMRLPGRC